MENYRKKFIRNNRVKKISSELEAVIKSAWIASHRFPTPALVQVAYRNTTAIAFHCVYGSL